MPPNPIYHPILPHTTNTTCPIHHHTATNATQSTTQPPYNTSQTNNLAHPSNISKRIKPAKKTTYPVQTFHLPTFRNGSKKGGVSTDTLGIF